MKGHSDISEINKETYESEDIVKEYSFETSLQEPERVILEILRERLPNYRMLDIGVGAGRTTRHFAPLVKEYTGADFSRRMIDACRSVFPFDFRVCDVRNMGDFPSNSFDLVLFSFNGLDYIGETDRARALGEIRRVSAPGGYFCFSSHNINNIPGVFTRGMALHPMRLSRAFERRLRSKPLLRRKASGFAIVDDGAHRSRVRTCYVNPVEQIKTLQTVGFLGVRTFGRDGREISKDQLAGSMDRWIYYLCQT